MLCLDVATRWNSTFFMLEAATTFEKVVYRYELIDSTYKKDLEVKQNDLEIDDEDEDVDEDRVQGVPKEEDWMKAKLMLNFLRQLVGFLDLYMLPLIYFFMRFTKCMHC